MENCGGARRIRLWIAEPQASQRPAATPGEGLLSSPEGSAASFAGCGPPG